jgi:hypothetical protein
MRANRMVSVVGALLLVTLLAGITVTPAMATDPTSCSSPAGHRVASSR